MLSHRINNLRNVVRAQPSSALDYLKDRREGLCDDCRKEYATPWFAPNEIWNVIVPDRVGVLCPDCFIRRAQKQGYLMAWELRPESVPDQMLVEVKDRVRRETVEECVGKLQSES